MHDGEKSKPDVPGPAFAQCGAKSKRTGKPCRHSAGKRTDHPGQGRCWLHGGATPVKHGRYSRIQRPRIREILDEIEKDPDPLNIIHELHLLRALVIDFIERYDEWRDALLDFHLWFRREQQGPQRPIGILDVADASRILAEVTKVVERIHRMRSENAISRAEYHRVLREMGITVRNATEELELTDEAKDRFFARVQKEWREIAR